MNPENQGDEPGTVLPATQRKDGTWRKEVKIRPGYKNLEEMPKYMAPKKRAVHNIQGIFLIFFYRKKKGRKILSKQKQDMKECQLELIQMNGDK